MYSRSKGICIRCNTQRVRDGLTISRIRWGNDLRRTAVADGDRRFLYGARLPMKGPDASMLILGALKNGHSMGIDCAIISPTGSAQVLGGGIKSPGDGDNLTDKRPRRPRQNGGLRTRKGTGPKRGPMDSLKVGGQSNGAPMAGTHGARRQVCVGGGAGGFEPGPPNNV